MKLRKTEELKKKKATSSRKHPPKLPSKYPEDGPDCCGWVPNEAQSDGSRVHFMKILTSIASELPRGGNTLICNSISQVHCVF